MYELKQCVVRAAPRVPARASASAKERLWGRRVGKDGSDEDLALESEAGRMSLVEDEPELDGKGSESEHDCERKLQEGQTDEIWAVS